MPMAQVLVGCMAVPIELRMKASICSSVCTPGPGNDSLLMSSDAGLVAKNSRVVRTTVRKVARSLGSSRRFSSTRGGSCGFAERSFTHPRLAGRSSTLAVAIRWPSGFFTSGNHRFALNAVGVTSVWMSGRDKPGRDL